MRDSLTMSAPGGDRKSRADRPNDANDPGCVKRIRAKDAQNCFLNCPLPTAPTNVIGFRGDEIETEILHVSSADIDLDVLHFMGSRNSVPRLSV
jgi:hypothetical protein